MCRLHRGFAMTASLPPAPVRPSRRRFLAGAAAFVPALYLSGCATRMGGGQPFSLGVASGEPRPDGVTIWTRLAPDPLHDGGMPPDAVEVGWTVAEDAQFARVVRRGTVRAIAADAHSVHVDVDGLNPGRYYWYRFIAGGEASPAGRTRTAPEPGAAIDRVRFAFASCQQYEQGYYAAHRHMAAEELDLVVFLGDYIYETSWGRDLVRSHGAPETFTLGDYRNRYALYRSDADLQACHAAHPWVVTWDDHEVANDYANDRGEHTTGKIFLARRAAAYKAFWEHMPLSPALRPGGDAMRLYRSFDYGGLARFAVLDDRQYRSHQPCPKPGLSGGGGTHPESACTVRLDPALTMLGTGQEQWLQNLLDRSPARWNILAQQTRMAQFDVRSGPDRQFWTDGWDGYAAARRRLLDFIGARKPSNPLVIGGDIHTTVVSDLKPDFDDPHSPVVATEICGTSITSYGPRNRAVFGRLVRENPHVRYGNGWSRGYVRVTLDRRNAVAALRGVDDAQRRDSGIATVASFSIEDGRPGVRVESA